MRIPLERNDPQSPAPHGGVALGKAPSFLESSSIDAQPAEIVIGLVAERSVNK
jgi:hypothetical protein